MSRLLFQAQTQADSPLMQGFARFLARSAVKPTMSCPDCGGEGRVLIERDYGESMGPCPGECHGTGEVPLIEEAEES